MRNEGSPLNEAERRDQLLDALLRALGVSDPFVLYVLKQDLEYIEHQSARFRTTLVKQPDPDAVRRLRASVARMLTLSEKVGNDFLTNEIEKIILSQLNPDADEQKLHTWMTDPEYPIKNLIALLTPYLSAIDQWLEINSAKYQRRDIRKLVVEPFLRLMAKHDITTSRKQRPRKKIFDALFDWLEIEPKYRPTSANIDAIAREMEPGTSELKRNTAG
ncbi:hypothetical protein QCM80_02505 [Bradyrhizobium sp. SSUT112]|uniref:hypothetical protein n=1 Tax=Bradyrhizobium sp. SSUT112 TaxID=3040604 RepID=UPI0024472F72|nr:hypothetical protein [Bradyrhizobium sp. SSUT112]MDH2349555.1 hypothetical protein [Bradyrhizobium sp. SSUT112]